MNTRKPAWALAALLIAGAAGLSVWKMTEKDGDAVNEAVRGDRAAGQRLTVGTAPAASDPERRAVQKPRRVISAVPALGKGFAQLADTDSSNGCLFGPTARCGDMLADLQACDGGDGPACTRAADEIGYEAPRDLIVERALRKKACEHGVAEACAELRERSELVASLKDDAEASKRASRACQDGDAIACHALVERHQHDEDRSIARAATRKMCELGVDRQGCIDYALQADPDEAGWALDTACSAGSPDACRLLAHHHLGFTANPAGISDLARALAAYDRACQLAPDHVACAEADKVRASGGLPDELESH